MFNFFFIHIWNLINLKKRIMKNYYFPNGLRYIYGITKNVLNYLKVY